MVDIHNKNKFKSLYASNIKNYAQKKHIDVPKLKLHGKIRSRFSSKFLKENKEMYDRIFSMLDENDHNNFLKTYKLFVNYEDDDQMLNNINTNTLVTTGQYDVGSTTEMAKNLSEKIKGAKYIEIKDGKHLCNIECAEKFNKTIELFIDQNYDEA